MPHSDTVPKVSVLMITYNHEAYVAQAIDSVLAQRTNFAVELVIGEDCSRDGTRAIVAQYQAAHPTRVRVLLPEQNLGVNANFLATLRACRGEYVAMLEGDDYWLSPDKLQQQVDFLDSHPDYTLCAHEAYDEALDGTRACYVRLHGAPIQETYRLPDILQQHFLPTASMLFRRRCLQDPPPELAVIPGVDWLMQVVLAEQGPIGFIDAIWSVRRIHAGGLTSLAPTRSQLRHTAKTVAILDDYLQKRHTHLLRPRVLNGLVMLAAETVLQDDAESTDVIRKLEQAVAPLVAEFHLSSAEQTTISRQAMGRLLVVLHDRQAFDAARACWLAVIRTGNLPVLRRWVFWSIGLTVVLGPGAAVRVRRLIRGLLGRGDGA